MATGLPGKVTCHFDQSYLLTDIADQPSLPTNLYINEEVSPNSNPMFNDAATQSSPMADESEKASESLSVALVE
jgi:hypothetical protein